MAEENTGAQEQAVVGSAAAEMGCSLRAARLATHFPWQSREGRRKHQGLTSPTGPPGQLQPTGISRHGREPCPDTRQPRPLLPQRGPAPLRSEHARDVGCEGFALSGGLGGGLPPESAVVVRVTFSPVETLRTRSRKQSAARVWTVDCAGLEEERDIWRTAGGWPRREDAVQKGKPGFLLQLVSWAMCSNGELRAFSGKCRSTGRPRAQVPAWLADAPSAAKTPFTQSSFIHSCTPGFKAQELSKTQPGTFRRLVERDGGVTMHLS
ncbi:Hypothetical predicted protein [Marmota monax]|uniref:Uncharacterized protein n=1 Tax=Marmota monax TaxID=9995 RepID=A0A5E4C0W0_MARMO|nr:hypothetical protein GHT09_015007 [Marmota monax]VTJ75494.1 Hypothetical predicted protein [Marmota monax]